MGVHDGHRKRVKDEFLERGLDGIPEHRVLELLLYYSVPQGDVNPLAHRLIEQFGSLAGVLDAPQEELLQVPGVGEHTMTLLKLFPAVGARYLKSRKREGQSIRSTEDARELFAPYFFGQRNEVVCLACLDAKYKLLNVRVLSEGSANGAEITTRKVVEAAFAQNASVLLLAHNHTSGVAVPSEADRQTTRFLAEKLRGLGLYLKDHLVFSDDEAISMYDSGMMDGLY